jgi:hypothetical protein
LSSEVIAIGRALNVEASRSTIGGIIDVMGSFGV